MRESVFTVIFIYYCLIKGYDMQTSTTIDELLWMADTISSLLNHDSVTMGPFKAGDLSIFIVEYSALNDFPGLDLFSKEALTCLVSPSLGIKLSELKVDDELT